MTQYISYSMYNAMIVVLYATVLCRYHDMDDVLDFIIPAETFRSAVSEEFAPGMHFKSFIEDSWWSGVVIQREAFSQQFPNSYWLCYKVQWDDGIIESISPWDMTVEGLYVDVCTFICRCVHACMYVLMLTCMW